jgi:hypothetical protein
LHSGSINCTHCCYHLMRCIWGDWCLTRYVMLYV